ncbi:MAG TPA: tetratricopeptide repeat protein, partial [Verrucomicrobiae bacterium]|nr:tetratricopeptide repeat protein [Verrucomicrobiae bacterium]
YRYEEPVFLPKGTTMSMRYVYDNSTNNPANPNQPPRRVAYGPNSTDEMAELWFQVLPVQPKDLSKLEGAVNNKMMKVLEANYRHMLETDSTNAAVNRKMGGVLLGLGRSGEAAPYFRAAAASDPKDDEPHYYLGLILRMQKRAPEASVEFERALQLNPRNYKAHGNLGMILAERGALADAEEHLRAAVTINPNDGLAREWLQAVEKARAERAGGKQ